MKRNRLLSNRGKISIAGLISAGILLLLFRFFGSGFLGSDHTPAVSGYESRQTSPGGYEQREKFYYFRTEKMLHDHFLKHRNEFNYADENEYLRRANMVINDAGSMSSRQADGDTQYLNSGTCEYVVLSTDRYIRTYFRPRNCVNYFNRQK
jgi:hypothetical protein